jgi:hypothetical protein
MVNIPHDSPRVPGVEPVMDMLLLTPFDGILIAIATWLLFMLPFLRYNRGAKELIQSLRQRLMRSSVELFRLSKAFSACVPDVMPRRLYANQIVAADTIRRLRDDGVDAEEYDADEIIQQDTKRQQSNS